MLSRSPRIRRTTLVIVLLAGSACCLAAGPAPTTQNIAAQVPRMSPEQAAASITVPNGFHVSLFASEPVIRQPIGLATDARGRLWVAENNTYSDARTNFDLTKHDRIVILDDTDGDGRADRHTVFWDKAQKLTSVEIGFGGVWALCPPRLLFIPDRNGDDVPDGEPQVVLDGFDDGPVRHNIANGLRWGPDGWLYGRHGILATSHVGVPGCLPSQRTPLNCCIWRYHPSRKIFEIVCHGTTNPWGMDWNEHGELFFINTVIGHLWHAVPGAHFERMYGEDDNPHVYQLLGQTADHVHWDAAERWSDIRKIGVSSTTDQAGGGHAHAGLLIYQGGNWPDRYRGSVFMINFHGRRLNNDTLERQGSGYVARHAADFLKSGDPWFRGLELLAAADGGVYVADWSDTGECHGADGVHLDSGRIYKVVYGHPSRPGFGDLALLSNSELVALQVQKNDWYVRQSRRILYERSAAGLPMDAVHTDLRRIFATDSDPIHQLRALWCLYVTGGASDDWLRVQLHHSDEHVRVWAIRLLGNSKSQPAQSALELSKLAARDSAGLVLLYLASTLEKLPLADRWQLATALAARSELATDRVLPLMIWYGIEPTVPENPDRALQLVESTQMLPLVRCVARRLTEDLRLTPRPVDGLVRVARQSRRLETTRAILSGIAEALRGWRHAAMPPSWKTAQSALESSPDLEIRRLTRELAAVFGDGRALDDLKRIASSKRADPAARRDAVRVLVEAQTPGLQPLLRRMLDERELGPDAARSLAVCDDPQLPQFLLGKFTALKEPTQDAVIVTLCARPASARLLLGAVESGAIARGRLPAFQVRQMAAFPDADVRQKIAKLWPELKTVSAAKRKRIEQLKGRLEPAALTAADPIRGRRRFIQTCAACHTLFGQGGKIGPDLTGSQRSNLDYLLENIVDPSAIVAPPYRMSTIALADGRLLNGIVVEQSGSTLTVQTPTERSTVNRADVESIRKSDLSLMPDGLLDVLPEKEVRDLVAYLMSPQQVSLQTEQFSGERHDSQGVR